MYNIRKSSCIRFMQMYIMIFDDINKKMIIMLISVIFEFVYVIVLDRIGWRKKVRRMIIYVIDSNYYQVGDG